MPIASAPGIRDTSPNDTDHRQRLADGESKEQRQAVAEVARIEAKAADRIITVLHDHFFAEQRLTGDLSGTHTPNGDHDAQVTDAVRARLASHEQGREDLVPDLPTARALVRERLGCAFKTLPRPYQSDSDVLMQAAINSGGHELKYAPPEARALLTPEFLTRAIEDGASRPVLASLGADIAAMVDEKNIPLTQRELAWKRELARKTRK